jgi:hypothetical protein
VALGIALTPAARAAVRCDPKDEAESRNIHPLGALNT